MEFARARSLRNLEDATGVDAASGENQDALASNLYKLGDDRRAFWCAGGAG